MQTLNLDPRLLLVLLLFSQLSCFHIVVPVSAKVLMNIDCGSSSPEPYTDKSSLVWVADDQYVKTGETRNVITKDLPPAWDSHVMSTLREFSILKKNCYSLDVDNKSEDSTSVERVLLRASFFYGNYDNKSSPPTFRLQFNGNNWTQVVTSMDRVVYHEVVYSLNSISSTIIVCLGQTNVDNFPFISALEVRSLDSDIYSSYSDPNYPLFFDKRVAFGVSTTVRYPEDSYGRIWNPIDIPSTAKVRNNSTSLEVNIGDRPPDIVMRTSAVNLISSANITLQGKTDFRVPFHINIYFSEVMILSSTQKRSFSVIVNGYFFADKSYQEYGPVIPPYGRALEVRFENVTADPFVGIFKIEIVPTKDSTLPPLINAVENFYIGDKLVQGTNSSDVISLGLLQKSFIQLQDWTGDPCLPSPYTWEWVACDSDTDSPRVIALYLNDLGLIGSLPDFSAMDALQTIDFSNNNLTLAIPEFLGTLPKLDLLNLEGNNFSGEIPCSLLKNSNLKLSVTGNPNLSLNNNTSICKSNIESRIPSASNSQNCITTLLPIIILGSILIQMLM
ncbi:probable LRR receptor-like serine/threonine-protein kinase At1g05700 [Papaver somniferum]|uniref:probable LRR receptor-like serine/threonine-protein kinase At1g05700 n=1 Tax=Papaver somniferum TaxID=3469 RepID=UPI000E6FEC28|nr:probable LRR receptor-like serine/threonine-protein kinase At1g05700 [Papaver somniferum]